MSDGAAVYEKDGIIFVRASAFGYCMRKLWAVWDGVQPMEHKDVIKRAFADGHLHEAAVVEQLTEEGYVLSGDQHEVIYKAIPNKLHIVGHIDGFIDHGTSTNFDVKEYGDSRLWECKSMSRSSFESWAEQGFAARQGYAWQLSIYMLGAKKTTAHYTVKRKDDGFIQDTLIDELPKSKTQITARALAILKMLRSGEMPDCDPSSGGEKYFCEYWFLHDEQEEVALDDPTIPADNNPELDDALADYYEAVETEKWAKKERERLKKKIQAEFRNDRTTFGTDHFTVKINKSPRRNFDKSALAADLGAEIVNKYTKKISVESWKIEPRRGNVE